VRALQQTLLRRSGWGAVCSGGIFGAGRTPYEYHEKKFTALSFMFQYFEVLKLDSMQASAWETSFWCAAHLSR